MRTYGCSYQTAMVEGCKSLRKPKIQAELKSLREIKNLALGDLCGDDVVELHMRIAFADITDFVEFKSRRVPDTDSKGELIYITHPKTGEQILKTHVETDMLIRDSASIDGTLVSEVSESREGMRIKLSDRMKSLQFLETYFELNPNDKHRRSFDNAKLDIEREKLSLLKERDDIEMEDTEDVDGVIYG
jgi:phage terminase small subunit